jgi:hypothetical protein
MATSQKIMEPLPLRPTRPAYNNFGVLSGVSTLWSIAVQTKSAAERKKMILANKITNIVKQWCEDRDDYPNDGDLALLDERIGSYLDMSEAAQEKVSTATRPQQTQAVICSNNECAYCDKPNYGCKGDRVKCMGFSGRKLTAI